MKNRIIHFDLMRSIAIIIILIYHLPGYSFNFYDLNMIGINIDSSVLRELSKYFGLGLFIFISGYLSNLKGRSFSGVHTIKEYALSKIVKIFPLYYLALIAFYYIYDIKEPMRVAVHILGLQLVFTSQLIQPAPTLWFIGLIVIYYATYIFVRAEKVDALIKVLVLTLFPIIVLAVNRVFHLMDLRIVLYYGIFLLGLYSARHDIFRKISWAQTIIAMVVFTGFLIIYGDYAFATNPLSTLSSYFIVNVLMFLFIDLAYKSCLFFSERIKLKRLVEIISYSSFCMFLFHRPVWSLMHDVLSGMHLENEGIMAMILLAIGIPIIVAISYSVQRLYDKIVFAH